MSYDLDAIVIDDDPLVHATWELAAEKNDKKMISFYNPHDFFKIFPEHIFAASHNVPIYIDANLGEGIQGEIIAKEIYAMGYRTIYLITGYEKEHFSTELYWITAILGKSPPWSSYNFQMHQPKIT